MRMKIIKKPLKRVGVNIHIDIDIIYTSFSALEKLEDEVIIILQLILTLLQTVTWRSLSVGVVVHL